MVGIARRAIRMGAACAARPPYQFNANIVHGLHIKGILYLMLKGGESVE